MTDLISIIVPVYNVAAELPRCLDSILAQSYSQIEIVAVDDGSTDESGMILDNYAEKNLNIRVIHKENGGVTSARLRGVEESSGEWVSFVDGDDEIEPDMYEQLLTNAKKHDAQISHCGYQMCFSDGRVHYFHNTGLLVKQDKTTALRELLSGSIVEPGLWNKLFHKTLLHSLFHEKNVDLSIKINEDLLMNFYLFLAAENTVFEDWCPYHYIVKNTSASRTELNPNRIYDPIRVKEIIRRESPDDLKPDAQIAYLNSCMSVYHTLITSGSGYRDDIRRIRQMLRHEKNTFYQLGKKRALMANLIVAVPVVYRPVYLFYQRFLQKNAYV